MTREEIYSLTREVEINVENELKYILPLKLYNIICASNSVITGSYLLNKINSDIEYDDIDIYVNGSVLDVVDLMEEYFEITDFYRDNDLVYFESKGYKINLLSKQQYAYNDVDFDVIQTYIRLGNNRPTSYNLMDQVDGIIDKYIDTMNMSKLGVKTLYRMFKYEDKGFTFNPSLKSLIIKIHNEEIYNQLVKHRKQGCRGEIVQILNDDNLRCLICKIENINYENSFIMDMSDEYVERGIEYLKRDYGSCFLKNYHLTRLQRGEMI